MCRACGWSSENAPDSLCDRCRTECSWWLVGHLLTSFRSLGVLYHATTEPDLGYLDDTDEVTEELTESLLPQEILAVDEPAVDLWLETRGAIPGKRRPSTVLRGLLMHLPVVVNAEGKLLLLHGPVVGDVSIELERQDARVAYRANVTALNGAASRIAGARGSSDEAWAAVASRLERLWQPNVLGLIDDELEWQKAALVRMQIELERRREALDRRRASGRSRKASPVR